MNTQRYNTAFRILFALYLSAITACASPTQKAGKLPSSPIYMEVSVGKEFDSNSSVNELDANTGVSDVIDQLTIDIEYQNPKAEKTQLDLGYRFSSAKHEKFTEFDITTHLFSASLSREISKYNIGLSYNFADNSLGGQGYMDFSQGSLFASRRFGRKFFTRAYTNIVTKDFTELNERNADVVQFGLDVYFFLKGTRRYISTGFRHDEVNTIGDEFEYSSNRLKLRFVQKLPIWKWDSKFSIDWRHDQRDYLNDSSALGVKRVDDRQRFSAELEIPFSLRLYGQLALQHQVTDSNLSSAIVDRDVISITLGARI